MMGFDTLDKFNVFYIRLNGTRRATCLVIERKGVPTRWMARALSDYKTVVWTGKLLSLNLKVASVKLLSLNLKVASVISGLKSVLVRWNSTEEKRRCLHADGERFGPFRHCPAHRRRLRVAASVPADAHQSPL